MCPVQISALITTHLLSPGDICRLPPEKGPCKGKMPRFFYNPASRTCESFIYGGCKGNKNNFKTKAECVRACGPPERPGVCPKITGPGICLHGCNSDSDCKEGQKCCFNGCGYTCMFCCPVPPGTRTCLPVTAPLSPAALLSH
uniref:Uncharacterized protein n=1 Tax=Chrysemys picta bellii TaxID=8478 RepID=A0A8C3IV45_CHRPI